MEKHNALCSWSGGKDSCFALIKAIPQGYTPRVLLNVLNEEGRISRSHGIPASVLQQQANSAKLPVHLISNSWNEYEQKFTEALVLLKEAYRLDTAVFGDIDLQVHRDWEEKVCSNAGLHAILPLWLRDRKKLVLEMLDAGIETIIVSCNQTMGRNFIGKTIDKPLVEELEKMGIDPCGENGEYHTLVLNCPLFTKRIDVKIVDKLLHDNYWFAMIEEG